MTESDAIAEALQHQGELVSGVVRSFLEQARSGGLEPTPFGYLLYRYEPGDGLPVQAIRLTAEGVLHFDGEAGSLGDGFADGRCSSGVACCRATIRVSGSRRL